MARIHSVSVPDLQEETWRSGQVLARRRGWSMSNLIVRLLEREVRLSQVPDAYLPGLEDGDEEVAVGE